MNLLPDDPLYDQYYIFLDFFNLLLPGKDNTEVTLNACQHFNSLQGLLYIPHHQLMDIFKDENLASQIELFKHVVEHSLFQRPCIIGRQGESPDMLRALVNLSQEYKDVESMRVFYMGKGYKIIDHHTQCVGTDNQVLADPKAVARHALKGDATGVILVHNHPSNQLQPSKSDRQDSLRMKAYLNSLGLELYQSYVFAAGQLRPIL